MSHPCVRINEESCVSQRTFDIKVNNPYNTSAVIIPNLISFFPKKLH